MRGERRGGGGGGRDTAARPDHDLDAVVDLSGALPERYYTGPSPSEQGVGLAARIGVPVMYASARDDEDFQGAVHRELFAATRAEGKRLVRLRDGGHAMAMLGHDQPSRFYRTRFSAFLDRHS